jgi:hypothetical protein
MPDARDTIVVLLIEALTTPGEQYKQFYLEKLFRLLVHDEWVDKAKTEFKWTNGIDPNINKSQIS